MNRPKKQGTAFETAIVTYLKGCYLRAERIAEGGSRDLGDIRITDQHGQTVLILEAKSRAALNIHDALLKAINKADPLPAAVVWKRLVRKGDNKRRTSAGPVVVAMSLDTLCELLEGR